MCWYECLSLGADWSEDTFLREAHTVCASTIFRLFETRAANLDIKLAACERGKHIDVPCDGGNIDRLSRCVDEVQAGLEDIPSAALADKVADTLSVAAAERDTDRGGLVAKWPSREDLVRQ